MRPAAEHLAGARAGVSRRGDAAARAEVTSGLVRRSQDVQAASRHRREVANARRRPGDVRPPAAAESSSRTGPSSVPRTARTNDRGKRLTLIAMIFAVAMTFIDQTIVSVAAPDDPARARPDQQRYAVGDQRLPAGTGRVVRVRGPAGRHGRVTAGWSCSASSVFAAASALCGLTPSGPLPSRGW